MKTNEEGFKEAMDKSKGKYKKKTTYYKNLYKELQKSTENQNNEQKILLEQKFQAVLNEKDQRMKEISESYDKKLVKYIKIKIFNEFFLIFSLFFYYKFSL